MKVNSSNLSCNYIVTLQNDFSNILIMVIKNFIIIEIQTLFLSPLIGAEGAQTPAGLAGQVRPRRSKATRRLSASPAESEAPGAEINGYISKLFF
jgi:hypothetical protein